MPFVQLAWLGLLLQLLLQFQHSRISRHRARFLIPSCNPNTQLKPKSPKNWSKSATDDTKVAATQ